MADPSIATKEVGQLRHLIQGVAKNFVDRVYGPHGPEWGTRFVEIEDLAVQIGRSVSREMCDQALQRQAQEPVPPPEQVCPSCGKPLEAADPEPRIVQTRAGDAQWQEPHRYCRHCRRSFFPSVETPGD
jgi:hypothetical protein